jgi:hypothetical protein
MLLIPKRRNNPGGMLMAPVPAPRTIQNPARSPKLTFLKKKPARSPKLTFLKLARSPKLTFLKLVALAAVLSALLTFRISLQENGYSRNLHTNMRTKSADLSHPFPPYSHILKKSAEATTTFPAADRLRGWTCVCFIECLNTVKQSVKFFLYKNKERIEIL